MAKKLSIVAVFAQNAAALRRLRGYSQVELADRAGVSVSYVSMLERGLRVPPLTTVQAVAEALKVKAADLLWSR